MPSKNDFVSFNIDKRCSCKGQAQWGQGHTNNAARKVLGLAWSRSNEENCSRMCRLRKVQGMPFKPQSTPDLPDMCVADTSPFTYTGVDFAGPLHITSLKHQ